MDFTVEILSKSEDCIMNLADFADLMKKLGFMDKSEDLSWKRKIIERCENREGYNWPQWHTLTQMVNSHWATKI